MVLKHYASALKHRSLRLISQLREITKKRFECPICGYEGPFTDLARATGLRRHAQCPSCNALERHRIQFLVVNDVLRDRNAAILKMLHFAPEPFFRDFFSRRFGCYENADLNQQGVDYHVDLQQLPFANETYDFVFASHVLEHIPDDKKAIAEIRRILKPGGIAILPVPIVAEATIEYLRPNPQESNHVRAPGLDYFDRYERHFSKVIRVRSDSLPERYQLFLYEDRSQWPTKECPLRPAMLGEKHMDIVPVCYA